jgi:hypothetical protein
MEECCKMSEFQAYNGRIKAWVKFKRMRNGMTKVVAVKRQNPRKPFAGVPVKR